MFRYFFKLIKNLIGLLENSPFFYLLVVKPGFGYVEKRNNDELVK